MWRTSVRLSVGWLVGRPFSLLARHNSRSFEGSWTKSRVDTAQPPSDSPSQIGSNIVVRYWEHLRHSERGEKRVSTRDSSATIKNPATFLSLSPSLFVPRGIVPGLAGSTFAHRATELVALLFCTPLRAGMYLERHCDGNSHRARHSPANHSPRRKHLSGYLPRRARDAETRGESVGCVDGNRTIKLPSIVRIIENADSVSLLVRGNFRR